MPEIGNLADIARTIQVSIAPVFLLAGIGSLLNVLSGRLGRVIDRVRALEKVYDDPSMTLHERYAGELRVLDRRISLASDAIFLCVASAILVCGVVALLFVAEVARYALADVIALMFIVAMLLLVSGLVLFAVEVRVATRALHVRKELLRADGTSIR